MATAFLHIPREVRQAVWTHLLPSDLQSEEVAFMYANRLPRQGAVEAFEYVDWYPVPPEGFLVRSSFHVELTDETRARAIKQAHDLGTSLVELHCHTGPWPAEFSGSDLLGFREFVPHVWWRLRGRPYLAIVVSHTTFDGLVWLSDAHNPQHLDGLVIDGTVINPTKLSPLSFDSYGH